MFLPLREFDLKDPDDAKELIEAIKRASRNKCIYRVTIRDLFKFKPDREDLNYKLEYCPHPYRWPENEPGYKEKNNNLSTKLTPSQETASLKMKN